MPSLSSCRGAAAPGPPARAGGRTATTPPHPLISHISSPSRSLSFSSPQLTPQLLAPSSLPPLSHPLTLLHSPPSLSSLLRPLPLPQ